MAFPYEDFDLSDINRQEDDAATSLLPAGVSLFIAEEPIQTGSKEGAETGSPRIVSLEKVSAQGAQKEVLGQVLRIFP